LIVHGEDGVDELSLSAPTRVCDVRGDAGTLQEYTLTPDQVGMRVRPREEVRGGDAMHNAALLRSLLTGEDAGAPADMVALNAGAALLVTGRADSLADGVRQARDVLRSGQARQTLDALVTTTRELAGVSA
jgi:anthranilate phosphoribosyltransferase